MIFLTDTRLARFIGGQIKIHYPDSVCCGEIKTITIQNDELIVRLNWMAKGEGIKGSFPMRTVRDWVNDASSLDLRMNVAKFLVVNRPLERIRLENHTDDQYVFLCPSSAPLLNPRVIAGLRSPS